MTPEHTVTTRPADEEELQALEVRAQEDAFAGCVVRGIVIIGAGALPIALAVSVLIKIISGDGFRGTLDLAVHFGGILLSLPVAIALGRKILAAHNEGPHARDRNDELEAGVVQVIEASTDGAVLFHPYDRDGCNTGLAIDIGGGRTLVLYGAALDDEEIFDAEEWSPEHDPPIGLRSAFAFPAERFTIVRTPTTGYILSIATSGAFVEPEVRDMPGIDTNAMTDRESLVLDTPLTDLR